jgi:phage-related baseplate assembly protein
MGVAAGPLEAYRAMTSKDEDRVIDVRAKVPSNCSTSSLKKASRENLENTVLNHGSL